jgi:hypothetical protein
VDPETCNPIYPNQYLKVNTVFELAHKHHLRTAWSDKHPAYLVLAGPSGEGVDDFFTPEMNSSANPAAPTDPNQPDWTKDNLSTQQYDSYKVQAVINWINGHLHDGSGDPGTPAIFGMNFQTVSTAQKLPASKTEGDLTGTALGGYLADGATPGPVLSNALDFVDQSLGSMVSALSTRGLLDHTAILVSAEHGGNHLEDRSVPILPTWPGAAGGTAITRPVETTQIAPTILKLLGLNPNELQAVRIEGTQPLF